MCLQIFRGKAPIKMQMGHLLCRSYFWGLRSAWQPASLLPGSRVCLQPSGAKCLNNKFIFHFLQFIDILEIHAVANVCEAYKDLFQNYIKTVTSSYKLLER